MDVRKTFCGSRRRIIVSGAAIIVCLFAYFYRLPGAPFVEPAYEEDTMKIVVLDEEDERIAGAMVTPIGLRTVQEPGSWHGWLEDEHGSIKTVSTDQDGIVEVTYPKWVSRETGLLTSTINVAVEHSDYCFESGIDCKVPSAGAMTVIPRIHLHKGGRLRIKAFRQNSVQPLTEFRALVSGHWYSRPWKFDGEAMCSAPITAGEHVLRIVDFTDPESLQFSDPFVFECIAGKTEEHELRLRPGLTIRGELDVPKPVERGFVLAYTTESFGGQVSINNQQSISWSTWTTVSENGAFEIHSFPPTSSVEILAWCDGSVCQIPSRSTVPVHMQGVEPSRLPQFFTLTPENSFCRIEMEPCAKCEITVTDSSGRPIEGAEVGFAPNVSFRPRGSWWFGSSGRDENVRPAPADTTFADVTRKFRWHQTPASAHDPDHLNATYDALTNVDGKATIKTLPGRGVYRAEVTHKNFVVRGSDKPPFTADIEVELKPGETSKLNIVVVPKPALTDQMLKPPSMTAGRTLVQLVRDSIRDTFGW